MILFLLLIAAVIVALIASYKGLNIYRWFLYGFVLAPVALVHVLLQQNMSYIIPPLSAADKVKRLAELETLKEMGSVSLEEYEKLKAEMMRE